MLFYVFNTIKSLFLIYEKFFDVYVIFKIIMYIILIDFILILIYNYTVENL